MARIIGGIGTSHVPTIAMAFDKARQNDPDWKPLFKGYEPVAKWLADKKPDVLFFCFNDHATTFFFDHYPIFALGVGEEYRIADEGLGIRPIPRLKGHAKLARHVARSVVDDEFDLAIFQDLPLDHGLHSPLTMMWPKAPDWPGAIVPLVGTGGLSHQMIGERAGFNDEKWDLEFLELIERDPERLADMTIEDFMRRGGNEGAEVIMWLIMRGALDARAKKVHQNYYLPMTTAMAVALF